MSEWNICIENCTIISIYLNILLVFTVFTLWHTYERMSKYILTNKFGTNECPNVIICDQYIQIFQNACIQDVCICIYDPGSRCVCINLSTNKQTSRSLIHVFGECMMHTSRILGSYCRKMYFYLHFISEIVSQFDWITSLQFSAAGSDKMPSRRKWRERSWSETRNVEKYLSHFLAPALYLPFSLTE